MIIFPFNDKLKKRFDYSYCCNGIVWKEGRWRFGGPHRFTIKSFSEIEQILKNRNLRFDRTTRTTFKYRLY